ncbi:uncharacterized protein SAPINGB_P000461 [Magnusiomyces paraingens]|uniref:Major facilitator superfamily (MFS) profile domain-containing protein n=1 Tax=Magnusiomyces paraingens TaxID=2606893 RepID=A0A5E8B4K8_9ASCO|nr:uncharacterized protein SAPINGB_P000461 [Saprochaete ingens]VVT44573.1 unnamed protein product [Saprochaete ingens]
MQQPISAQDSHESSTSSSSNQIDDPEKFFSKDLEANINNNNNNINNNNNNNNGDFSPQQLSRRNSIASEMPSLDEQEAISRVLTGRIPDLNAPCPPMGGDRDYPPLLPQQEQYRVDFTGPDDPLHPFNWPLSKKIVIASCLGATTFTSVWGSSVFSPALGEISEKFHVANVVSSLTIALFVLGFASGPIIWSPLSELYGRKFPIVIALFLFTCFTFATATAKDLQTVIICRFFSGISASAPLTIVAAVFADIFPNTGAISRGTAINIFAAIVFSGPMVAPIVGGFIVQSYLGWRWTEYLTGIMSGTTLLAVVLFMEETYTPIILVHKAQIIRERTGNWGVHAVHENVTLDLSEIITKTITRPLRMLVSEPIILLLAIYNGFCYLILYLCLSSYPYAFRGLYHFALNLSMLPYLGILIGMILCAILMILFFEPRYERKLLQTGVKSNPELRLEPVLLSALVFPIGLFWFFWTANYADHVHWIVPTISGIFTGFGLMGIMVPSMNYIVDAYLWFAASALAALTFLRSMFGASAPLFADFMFDRIHLNWSGLLLGLLAVAMAPVPYLFFAYGKKIRGVSKYAFDG